MEVEIQNKSEEIRRIEEVFEQEKKEIDANNLKEVERVRNEWHVTQMLFDQFKEDMVNKYGYDSNAESSEEEFDYDKDRTENTVCNKSDFKAKTREELKTHGTKKHK